MELFLAEADPMHPGFAMKAIKSGYAVGKALQSWTGSGDRILAYLNVSYAVISGGSDPADLSDLQGPTLSEDWTNVDLATISGSLKVLGLTELANTNIGGSLQVGLLHFDDVKAEISSLTGTVTVLGTLKADKIVTNEINMKDSETGKYYCVRIKNGDFDKALGMCPE